MDPTQYLALFREEAREHVEVLNRSLLALERRPDDTAAVDEVFRAAHTMKGMAAAMGFRATADLAHALEHTLHEVRSGTLRVDAVLVDRLLDGADALEKAAERDAAGVDASGGSAPAAAAAAVERTLRVKVEFEEEAALPAVRAVMVLRNARVLGRVGGITPREPELQRGELAGALTFELTTAAREEEIRRALSAAGEIAEVVVDAGGESGGRARGTVRVRADRLDSLLDHLGEMVIARDRLEREAARLPDPELAEAVASVTRLVGGLRDEVLGLRTVPVGEVFGRFPRLVRDAARALDREVALELVGESEELDRSLTSELGDLLVHLVRNSVDHGIEPPEERERAGKPRLGRLRLSAERTRSGVVVRVEDDGRGLQRGRILERAVERGLVPAERAEALTDEEVFRFITLPGFSTAPEVTEVSGRGVGLDAVRARLTALGGALEVRSQEGVGTTFALRLPLSLSIVRVLLLEASGETYAVPTSAVVEVSEFTEPDVERTGEDEWLEHRGERLPLLRLPVLLGGTALSAQPMPVLFLEVAERRFALAVDRLVRQRELVVKPFDATLQMVNVFSGAALLADGRPCLMLDAARLAARVAVAPAVGSAPAAALT